MSVLDFLRRADAPRSPQSRPEKTRLTALFVNLSTALETCFASRIAICTLARVRSSRLRFSVQTVNFTIRDPLSAQAFSGSMATRFSVLFVNFTILHPDCFGPRARSLGPQFACPDCELRTRNCGFLAMPLTGARRYRPLPGLPPLARLGRNSTGALACGRALVRTRRGQRS